MKLKKILDKKGKLFGKIDLFTPLLVISFLVLSFFIAKVLLEKDTYITAELYASGGEWWWDNPLPPYWLTDPVQPGAIEYDPMGNKLVEVLETRKFEEGERKMLWVKVKLKVSPSKSSKQYRFRREPLQTGSLIYIAPNNIKIFCNVMWIEGTEEKRQTYEKIITFKEYDIEPWRADTIKVGDVMKDDSGEIMAEIIDKKVELAEMTTVDWAGVTHKERNPYKRDYTLKVKMKTIKSKDRYYFSYFQPLKIGFYIWIPLEDKNISGYITEIE